MSPDMWHNSGAFAGAEAEVAGGGGRTESSGYTLRVADLPVSRDLPTVQMIPTYTHTHTRPSTISFFPPAGLSDKMDSWVHGAPCLLGSAPGCRQSVSRWPPALSCCC